MRTIRFFASFSGLCMNLEKTQVVWIGSRKNSEVRFLTDLNFIWNPLKFKVLGVIFSTDVNNIVTLNFQGKLEDIRRLLAMWSRRYLTPYGKITVIKTLALSKLTFLFSSIPDPSPQFFIDLDKTLFDFLWDKKRSKIKRAAVVAPYDEGGLRMVDVASFAASLKISWLRRIFSLNNTLSKMLFAMCPEMEKLQIMGGEVVNITMKNIRTTSGMMF